MKKLEYAEVSFSNGGSLELVERAKSGSFGGVGPALLRAVSYETGLSACWSGWSVSWLVSFSGLASGTGSAFLISP